MTFSCQICNINQSQPFITKCCKLFICQQCKNNYENDYSQCVCNKIITNKKLCTENGLLHQIIQQFESKKQKQCDRCSQKAAVQCKNCCMVFCKTCQKELHNAPGYSKHTRQVYGEQRKKIAEIVQISKNKVKICQNHRQIIQFVCQCGVYLCNQCTKPHKQTCQKLPLKPKSFLQYKKEYFSQILYKLSQITSYKQCLQNEHKQFQCNFLKQQQHFKITQKSLHQQFSCLRKMLDIKIGEIQKKITEYWDECQKNYKKTSFYLQTNMKKYDDYAKLIQKLVQHEIGLDYLQKRVKKMASLNYNSFQFKTNNIEQVKNSILAVNSSFKAWEYQFHENIILNLEEPAQKQKNMQLLRKSDIFATTNPSQILFQANQKPLNPRIMSFNTSHNQIQYSFLHLPYQQFKYEIQYGVGFKMKGKQVFKKIENKNGRGYIQGLNPSTKYRIRMRVADGQFGEISEVTTLDSPKFNVQPSNFVKITNENSFQFLKQGTIYGTNPMVFGVHNWTIILNSQKSSYEESQTACITVGVTSKEQKKAIFVGSTFNYGYQREQIIVKIAVNCDQQTMTITSSQNNQAEQKFSNLPITPIFPAIQNKSNASVHIKYSFVKQQEF